MKKALSVLVLSSSFLFSQGFTLKSETISGQLGIKQVFNGFGCTGENISPKLSWENPPKKTKSFAITMYDPDAPTGSGWWHWIVFDIPKDKKELKESFGNKESKEIVQSVTDYGKVGFGGACPPIEDKAHKYEFTIYALDVEKLGLTKDTTPAIVGYYINQHTIEKSTITAYYKR